LSVVALILSYPRGDNLSFWSVIALLWSHASRNPYSLWAVIVLLLGLLQGRHERIWSCIVLLLFIYQLWCWWMVEKPHADPEPDEYYHIFKGESYVHGCMDGEALRDSFYEGTQDCVFEMR
jgi:Ca2+/Na+ antiporter